MLELNEQTCMFITRTCIIFPLLNLVHSVESLKFVGGHVDGSLKFEFVET